MNPFVWVHMAGLFWLVEALLGRSVRLKLPVCVRFSYSTVSLSASGTVFGFQQHCLSAAASLSQYQRIGRIVVISVAIIFAKHVVSRLYNGFQVSFFDRLRRL